MIQWRRIEGANEVEGLSATYLQGVAALWKKTGRRMTVRFAGSSMRPTIAPGQEVLLECTDEVSVGDVIVFIYLDQVVVHRLVARGKKWLLTRGDAHTIPDMPLADTAVIVGRIAQTGEPPRTTARSLTLAFARAAGLLGSGAIAMAIRVLRAIPK